MYEMQINKSLNKNEYGSDGIMIHNSVIIQYTVRSMMIQYTLLCVMFQYTVYSAVQAMVGVGRLTIEPIFL